MLSEKARARPLAVVGTAALCLALFTSNNPAAGQAPVGTAFTYQGGLQQGGQPIDEVCEFAFSLWDDPLGGMQIGADLSETVDVVDGQLTALLDFGDDIFTGNARWLEIAVCCPSPCEGFTMFSPRQELTPAPYALALPGLRTQQHPTSPNLIGGRSGIGAGVFGGTVGGGGNLTNPNAVFDRYGVVAGGLNNKAGDNDGDPLNAGFATVGGGVSNVASGNSASIAGGIGNTASGGNSTVGGGDSNTASGPSSTVGGGGWTLGPNVASDFGSTVGGGLGNSASAIASTVGGGNSNTASGIYSTVPGGFSNAASGAYGFAAGRRAQANHEGAFVWADSTDADFASSAANQFLIRASDGVGIGTSSPGRDLEIRKSVDGVVHAGVRNQNTGASALALLAVNADDAQGSITAYSSDYVSATFRDRVALSCATNSAGLLLAATAATGDIRLFTGGFASSNERMTIESDGNVGIGTTIPDGKLHVTGGNALFEGNVGIGTTSPLSTLDINAPGDGAELLRFTTERPWVFRQRGTGAATALELHSTVGSKKFVITADNGSDIATFESSPTGNSLAVPILHITGADLAEKFPVTEEVKPGTVVAIDCAHPGRLRMARGAYNRCVAGIVSGANGLSVGAVLGNVPGSEDAPPVALSGRVWCLCDAASGPIGPGDLLTTAGTPGHAMKVTDYDRAQGAILGKAMTALDKGRGLVLVLVTLQ